MNEEKINQEGQNTNSKKDGGVGPMIGSVIIIIIIIIGGFYYLNSITVRVSEVDTSETEMSTTTLNESDEIPAIEDDLMQTDLDNIDQEMAEILFEIEAEFEN